jgi:hypothetical protein
MSSYNKINILSKTDQAKRDRFLANASANTGMDRRFMSETGPRNQAVDYPRIFYLPAEEGKVGVAKNEDVSPLTRDEYHLYWGYRLNPTRTRKLDLNYEPDAKLFQKYLGHNSSFLELVEKSPRTSQKARILLNKSKFSDIGDAFWDISFKVVSKATIHVGAGTTAVGVALLWLPVVGGGLIILGEGMTAVGTGVSVANDLRKGSWKGAALNASFHFVSRGVGNRLTDAKRIGFSTPYKQKEKQLIRGLNESYFNIIDITANEALDRSK